MQEEGGRKSGQGNQTDDVGFISMQPV